MSYSPAAPLKATRSCYEFALCFDYKDNGEHEGTRTLNLSGDNRAFYSFELRTHLIELETFYTHLYWTHAYQTHLLRRRQLSNTFPYDYSEPTSSLYGRTCNNRGQLVPCALARQSPKGATPCSVFLQGEPSLTFVVAATGVEPVSLG